MSDREIADKELANRIVDIVCEACGISKSHIYKKGRCGSETLTARILIAYFIDRYTLLMPRDIVHYIGYPVINRTTAYWYLRDRRKNGKTLYEERSPYQRKLREMKEKIETILFQNT